MPAMAVIFTRSFPARRFLGVLVRMAIISFTIPAVPWRLSRSSTLFSSTYHSVAYPVAVHPPKFFTIATITTIAHGYRTRRPEMGVSRDSVCLCRSR